jgi:hypothetical protein
VKQLILVLGCALYATAALAGEHLEPERSDFASYDSTVATVLKSAFERDVRARAVVEPSFQSEFAVGVKEESGAFRVFFLQPSAQVWQYTLLQMMKKRQVTSTTPDHVDNTAREIARIEASLPADPKDLKVEQCEIAIDATLGARLVTLWKTILSQVKAQPPDNGIDGVIYHFSMAVDGHELAGQAWSPPKSSDAGMMVDIAYAMREACKTKNQSEIAMIDRLSADLQKRLQ